MAIEAAEKATEPPPINIVTLAVGTRLVPGPLALTVEEKSPPPADEPDFTSQEVQPTSLPDVDVLSTSGKISQTAKEGAQLQESQKMWCQSAEGLMSQSEYLQQLLGVMWGTGEGELLIRVS